MNLAEKISEHTLHVLFPEECSICGKDFIKNGLPLCSGCLAETEENVYVERCEKCAEKLHKGQCSVCLSRTLYFQKGFFFWVYEGTEKELFMMAKFENRKKSTKYLTEKAIVLFDEKINLNKFTILSLPSSNSFLRNILMTIAEKKNLRLYFPFSQKKKRQSKTLDAKDRFLALKDSLSLKEELSWLDKKTKYLLFDDVWTTGATLNMAAKILYDRGVPVKNIYTAAFFRRDKTQYEVQ